VPFETTSFIGREPELGEVTRLLRHHRLVTLGGAGGSGKTRLALRAAGVLSGSFRDGTWWVDLATLSDADLVAERVASALGVLQTPGRPTTESLVGHLAALETLVVLDNCEHLVGSCAALADALLRACAGVRLLVTSREPLGVGGEVSWPVPPLALPGPHHTALADLRRCAAVALFVERARAASGSFELTDDNAAAVVGVCTRLDGMPLAIELAASRTKVLAPKQILDRLDDRFRLLADRGRTGAGEEGRLMTQIDPRARTVTHVDALAEHTLVPAQVDGTEVVLLKRGHSVTVFEGRCQTEHAGQAVLHAL
jgi:non-specific serine/threonine protein kinase